MLKRGQITLFIIIAVIMLAAFGVGLTYLLKSGAPDAEQPLVANAALESASSSMKSSVLGCLEKRMEEGIDNYGLKMGESDELIGNYIDASMEDCVDFDFFEKKGYLIDEGAARAQVSIEENALIATLEYPITISTKAGSSSVDFENFEYVLPRTSEIEIDPSQPIPSQLRLVSEDGDMEILIPAWTKITLPPGSPNQLSIKMEDQNVDGLANRVVIGTTLYRGEPEGARFEEPIKVKLKIEYSDLPIFPDTSGIPTPLRYTLLKCAYYDEETDIWRTYDTVQKEGVVDNGPIERTYTITCYIDHFSLIGVVQCGSEDKKFREPKGGISNGPFYMTPVEPAQGGGEGSWAQNDPSKGGDSENKGAHLIPEQSTHACNMNRGTFGQQVHIYSGGTSGTAAQTAEYNSVDNPGFCDEYLLQDWDNDDKASESSADRFEYKFVNENFGEINPKNKEELHNGCYNSCKNQAGEMLQNAFSELQASGDGINDRVDTLYCTATEEMEEVCVEYMPSMPLEDQYCISKEEQGTGEYHTPVCKFGSAPDGEHPFNNLEAKSSSGNEPTMEYPAEDPSREQALLATPKTYGYFNTNGLPIEELSYDQQDFESEMKKLKMGGYAQKVLEMNRNGDSCVMAHFANVAGGKSSSKNSNAEIDIDSPGKSKLGLLSMQEDTKPLSLPAGTDKDISSTCTDNCVWTLNDPKTGSAEEKAGKISGGTNYMRVYSNSLASPDITPELFSEGLVSFLGKGQDGPAESYGDECWCLRESETEFAYCQLLEGMPDDGQVWVKREDKCGVADAWGAGGGELGNTGMPTFCSAEQKPTYYKCESPLGCVIAEEVAGEKGCQDDIYDCHYCNDIDHNKVCCASMKKVDGCASTLGCVPKGECADAGGSEILEGNSACEAFESGRVCCDAKIQVEGCKTTLGCMDSALCVSPSFVLETGNEACQTKVGSNMVCCQSEDDLPDNGQPCGTTLGCMTRDACLENPDWEITGNGRKSCQEEWGTDFVCCLDNTVIIT